MPRFIISEELVNYFVVEADSEDRALNAVAYRGKDVRPNHIDVIGYDTVEENSVEGYGVLGTLDIQDAINA